MAFCCYRRNLIIHLICRKGESKWTSFVSHLLSAYLCLTENRDTSIVSIIRPSVLMHYRLALHIVLRRKGRHRRQYSIKPAWESGSWCTVESVASIHHLTPLCLQKQSVLYAEMLNSKPVTHWENSVTARIYLPITCVCPHGSKG